jgi:hypothetical protein
MSFIETSKTGFGFDLSLREIMKAMMRRVSVVGAVADTRLASVSGADQHELRASESTSQSQTATKTAKGKRGSMASQIFSEVSLSDHSNENVVPQAAVSSALSHSEPLLLSPSVLNRSSMSNSTMPQVLLMSRRSLRLLPQRSTSAFYHSLSDDDSQCYCRCHRPAGYHPVL